jgi:hypothetical protein
MQANSMLEIGRRAIVCVLLLACGACNSSSSLERAAVKGTVLLDGQPLQEGRILFEPTAGNTGPSAGGSILNGAYEISADKGVVLGKNLVRINATKPSGKKVPSAIPDQMIDETIEAIPEQFNAKSTLERDVQPGPNQFNFELTSE